MESWRLVLRDGFLPLWSTDALRRGLAALEANDPFLTQGTTTTPPPLMCVADWKLEACDLIAYCSIEDPKEATVGEAEEGFAKACYEADQRLGEPAACRWLLNWYDDNDRTKVFVDCAAEFRNEIANRVEKEAVK
jgi:hypothetical protein